MKRLIIAASIAAAIGLPSIVIAQATPVALPVLCRAPLTGETANATMKDVPTPLFCHPVNMVRIRTAVRALRVAEAAQANPTRMRQMGTATSTITTELQMPAETIPGNNGGIQN